jgi:hypothetical protein
MRVDALAILAPGVIAVLGLLLRSRAGSSNLWDVMHELARGRVRTGLERERRVTLGVLLPYLDASAEREEGGSRYGADPDPLGEMGGMRSGGDQDSCS